MYLEKIVTDAVLGQAVGDAMGVPVEFLSRARVRSLQVRDMIGCEDPMPVRSRWGQLIPRGSWSDDTSMMLASMSSFVGCGGGIDHEDQMSRFARWWRKGEYCCLDHPFGLGGNISQAMDRFAAGTPALRCGGTHVMDNGNGALMRILPFSLYCIFRDLSPEDTAAVISDASAMTHGHSISKMCCLIWTEFLRRIVQTGSVPLAVEHIEGLDLGSRFPPEATDAVSFLKEGRTASLAEAEIGETGYVVDTLKTALYAMTGTSDYEASILRAIGLGYDTDTAAAVTGTAAGILYGSEGIPERWLSVLRGKDKLTAAARDFAACFQGS